MKHFNNIAALYGVGNIFKKRYPLYILDSDSNRVDVQLNFIYQKFNFTLNHTECDMLQSRPLCSWLRLQSLSTSLHKRDKCIIKHGLAIMANLSCTFLSCTAVS